MPSLDRNPSAIGRPTLGGKLKSCLFGERMEKNVNSIVAFRRQKSGFASVLRRKRQYHTFMPANVVQPSFSVVLPWPLPWRTATRGTEIYTKIILHRIAGGRKVSCPATPPTDRPSRAMHGKLSFLSPRTPLGLFFGIVDPNACGVCAIRPATCLNVSAHKIFCRIYCEPRVGGIAFSAALYLNLAILHVASHCTLHFGPGLCPSRGL